MKNEKKEAPLLSVISSGNMTPVCKVKFSNLVKPFYYPNSPKIPRYSITILLDPEKEIDFTFLEGMQGIERNENVESIIKKESYKKDGENLLSGKVILKFQTKDKIKTVRLKEDFNPLNISEQNSEGNILEDEIPKDSNVRVKFEILRYTKKNPFKTEHGLSFRPLKIYWIGE